MPWTKWYLFFHLRSIRLGYVYTLLKNQNQLSLTQTSLNWLLENTKTLLGKQTHPLLFKEVLKLCFPAWCLYARTWARVAAPTPIGSLWLFKQSPLLKRELMLTYYFYSHCYQSRYLIFYCLSFFVVFLVVFAQMYVWVTLRLGTPSLWLWISLSQSTTHLHIKHHYWANKLKLTFFICTMWDCPSSCCRI